MSPKGWAALADLIAIVHLLFVSFVVLGMPAIWIGFFFRARWVRNFWFRATHLACMALVVIESVVDFECPLTTWENQCRELAGQRSYGEEGCVEHYVHAVLFFEWSSNTFLWIYIGFFTLLVASLIFIPPRWPFGRPRWLFGTGRRPSP